MGIVSLSAQGWRVALLVPLLLALSATAEQAPRKVKVREGTLVPVRLKQGISSENCQRDQFLDLETVQDVNAEGLTVIRAGAEVRGQVDECSKARIAGQAGRLRIVVVSVKAVDDQNIPLRTTASRVGEDRTMQAVGGAFLCAPLIFIRGEASSYPAGAEFQAFTAGDKEIEVQ